MILKDRKRSGNETNYRHICSDGRKAPEGRLQIYEHDGSFYTFQGARREYVKTCPYCGADLAQELRKALDDPAGIRYDDEAQTKERRIQ